jgi:hypothetical protein
MQIIPVFAVNDQPCFSTVGRAILR